MPISFDDTGIKDRLYPFTATRSAADIRVGILTIREKWMLLQEKNIINNQEQVSIAANIIPQKTTAKEILTSSDRKTLLAGLEEQVLDHPWQIFQFNDRQLRQDFDLLTEQRVSLPVSSTNQVTNPGAIFIEPGAIVEHCILNASTGPIYIGRNANVMEGCMIRGPFAICEGAVLKMGTKSYGATTIGPYCVVGGELKNVVLFEYSNKAHDGYLGDSVVGAWCNLGAGTSNSNVLNTAGVVKVWDEAAGAYAPVGLKSGLLMGDYSRAAINTSFNTGTTVGVSCNVFGAGFPPKVVPSFSWGKERYTFEKAIEHIRNWKQIKGHVLTADEELLLQDLYHHQQ
ncbi:MAG: putative sugar nucleotidyl transferase [Bacteroidota bacterium]|nr:putative sugar nucleotidyl transferase [Ferruginibacter sp.]